MCFYVCCYRHNQQPTVQEENPCEVLNNTRYRKGPTSCFDYSALVSACAVIIQRNHFVS